MTTLSPLRLTVEDKLDALRKLDPGGQWQSLDDQRFCTRCDRVITGRQIEVAGGTRAHGPLRLECPTTGCLATPEDWTAPMRQDADPSGDNQHPAAPAPARIEIRNQREAISITHNGRAAVIRRSPSAGTLLSRDIAALQSGRLPRRRGISWLAHNILSVATDCRSLLSLLRPPQRGNFYPVH